MRKPRSLSSLLLVLGALALFASPAHAGAAVAKKPAAASKASKPSKARSEAAKKGWETRRINQKAEANWAARLKKNPGADTPGAKAAFLKRSVSAQKGWQTRKANMASKGSKKATKKNGKKVAKKTDKTKKTKTRAKKVAAADDGAAADTEQALIESAGVGNELFTMGLGKFDEARAAGEQGREVDAAVAQMEGHDAMAEAAFATAEVYEQDGRADEAGRLRDFGNQHLSRADAIELALGQMMPTERQPGPIKRFFSWLNPFKKRGGSSDQVAFTGE